MNLSDVDSPSAVSAEVGTCSRKFAAWFVNIRMMIGVVFVFRREAVTLPRFEIDGNAVTFETLAWVDSFVKHRIRIYLVD